MSPTSLKGEIPAPLFPRGVLLQEGVKAKPELGEQHKAPGIWGRQPRFCHVLESRTGNEISHGAAIANTGSNELLPQTQQEREEKVSKDNFLEVN